MTTRNEMFILAFEILRRMSCTQTLLPGIQDMPFFLCSLSLWPAIWYVWSKEQDDPTIKFSSFRCKNLSINDSIQYWSKPFEYCPFLPSGASKALNPFSFPMHMTWTFQTASMFGTPSMDAVKVWHKRNSADILELALEGGTPCSEHDLMRDFADDSSP